MPAAFFCGRRRRRHSHEFKVSAVAACRQLGVSMAALAMAHGISANLLRRCVRDGEMKSDVTAQDKDSDEAAALPSPPFVPVTIAPPAPPAPDIRIELRRGPVTIAVMWPSSVTPGYASCFDDPHRRDMACRRPHRHARWCRPASRARRAGLRRRSSASRLPASTGTSFLLPRSRRRAGGSRCTSTTWRRRANSPRHRSTRQWPRATNSQPNSSQ